MAKQIMNYVFIIITMISFNALAFTIDGNRGDWNDGNSILIKSYFAMQNLDYRVAKDKDNIYILIKKPKPKLIPIINGDITFFVPIHNQEYYILLSAKSTAPVAPKIVLSHDTSLLELSSKDIRSYSYNSGLVTKPGTDGFSVVHSDEYIEIKYPIRLIQARNTDSVQVIIGNADLEVKLPKSIKKKQPFNSSFMNKRVNAPFIPPGYDVRGAVAQTIVDQIVDGAPKVIVTSFVALTLGKGPVSGTVTIFADFKDGFSINGTLNADIGSDSEKPPKKSFDVALGLAFHPDDRSVFQNLGISVEAANMGVAFTVDSDTGNITADGMQIYVHLDSMPSVSAAYEKAIYDPLFGETIWSEIQLLLDNRITGMSANEFMIKNGMAILKSADDMENVEPCRYPYSNNGGQAGTYNNVYLGRSGTVNWHVDMRWTPDRLIMRSVKTGRLIRDTGFIRNDLRGAFQWDYSIDGGYLLVHVLGNPTDGSTKWFLDIECPQ